MDDLIAFLKDRLDEDEKLARAAIKGGLPDLGTPGRWNTYLEGGDDGWAIEDDSTGLAPGIIGDKSIADHITHHAPFRVLADIDAKRQIVALSLAAGRNAHDADSAFAQGSAYTAGRAVQMLLLPYADHPDYQARWAL